MLILEKNVIKLYGFVFSMSVLFSGCAYKNNQLRSTEKIVMQKPNDRFYSYGKIDVKSQVPKSGFYPLASPLESLAARVYLMHEAQKSIDIQYYLIGFDEVGTVIFKNALDAADRGVKVRILIDDMDLSGRDERLAMLDAHKNIEIRVFNPTYFRGPLKYLEMGFRSQSVGRRMHIKSFNVDNSAIVLGGRNLENSYFAADSKYVFLDNDILGIGPIASQLNYEFDSYWNSENVYALKQITQSGSEDNLPYLRQKAEEFSKKYSTSEYVKMAADTNFSKAFRAKALDLTFADGTIYYDDATKVSTDASDGSTHLIEKLKPYILNTTKTLRIINPYFVPNDKLMAFFKELRAKNIEIYILTNSLPSADAPYVYAFYQHYQKPMLEMGIHLYEVKSSGFEKSTYSHKVRDATGHFLTIQLHAKTMMIDDETLIIGSMNLDPRSYYLNAEIVGLIQSKELAARVKKQLFDVAFKAENSFELVLQPKPPYKEAGTGRLVTDEKEIVWLSEEDGQTVEYYNDAGASFMSKLKANLLYYLPIGGTI